MTEELNIFISWSGDASKDVAVKLREVLELASESFACFVSEQDIAAGARWSEGIAQQLRVSKIGIVVVTPGNLEKPWLNFEAGAIANQVGDSVRVVPLLVGLKASQIPPSSPLSQFQAKVLDEANFRSLIEQLADQAGTNSSRAIERVGHRLANVIFECSKIAMKVEPETPNRSREDILEEILLLTRSNAALLKSISNSRDQGASIYAPTDFRVLDENDSSAASEWIWRLRAFEGVEFVGLKGGVLTLSASEFYDPSSSVARELKSMAERGGLRLRVVERPPRGAN